MSAFFVSLLVSAAVRMLKYGIAAVYEARKLRRPNIRDKEGTRRWLENLLRWAAYCQQLFFADLATPAFTLGILLELVKPGEKWEALYAAILHDFNISQKFPPEKYAPPLPGEPVGFGERDRLIDSLCRSMKPFAQSRFQGVSDIDDLERQMVEEYLAIVRRLLDHPAVLTQAQRTWHGLRG